MQTKQSEELRALSLQEMEETNGGDAAAVMCGMATSTIGEIWGAAIGMALGGPVGGFIGASIGIMIGGAFSGLC